MPLAASAVPNLEAELSEQLRETIRLAHLPAHEGYEVVDSLRAVDDFIWRQQALFAYPSCVFAGAWLIPRNCVMVRFRWL